MNDPDFYYLHSNTCLDSNLCPDQAIIKNRNILIRAIPKAGIWFKVKEEAKRQPEEYMTYFEDWLFASDVEIESYSMQATISPQLVVGIVSKSMKCSSSLHEKASVALATGSLNNFGVGRNKETTYELR